MVTLSVAKANKLNLAEIPSVGSTRSVQTRFRTCPRQVKVVSLFSGCGGMDMGFLGGFKFLDNWYKGLPFDVVWANDINEFACRTYKHNLGSEIVCGDK